MTVRERLHAVALDRGLRQSTVLSYERLLVRMDLLDREPDEVSQSEALDAFWTIDNPNTRRAAVIALRSVFGWRIMIPKGVPRRYDLPDEDTLRIALMTSPHEARGLYDVRRAPHRRSVRHHVIRRGWRPLENRQAGSGAPLVNAHKDALDESSWVIPHAVYLDAQTKEFIGGYSPMEDECPQALSHIPVTQRHFVDSY